MTAFAWILAGLLLTPTVLIRYLPMLEVVIYVDPEITIADPDSFARAEACAFLRLQAGKTEAPYTIQWRKFTSGGALVPDEARRSSGQLRCQPEKKTPP